MRRGTDEFETLMAELARVEGPRLRSENDRWRDRVPERARRSAEAAVFGAGAALGLAAVRRGAAVTLPKWLVLALSTALALSIVTGGALLASPALRENAAALLQARTAQSESAQTAQRSPGDYVIPLPGADWSEQEGIKTESLQYRWFVSGERAVLIEIARRLPEGSGIPADAEPVTVGTLVGWAYEQEGARWLLLRDGETSILLSLNSGDAEALTEYAETFAKANGIG